MHVQMTVGLFSTKLASFSVCPLQGMHLINYCCVVVANTFMPKVCGLEFASSDVNICFIVLKERVSECFTLLPSLFLRGG